MNTSTPKFAAKLCRLCMVDSKNVISLFPPDVPSPRWQLIQMIREALNIRITVEDVFPKGLCRDCVVKVQQFHAFLFCAKEKQKQLMAIYNIKEPSAEEKQPKKAVSQKVHETSDEDAVDSPAAVEDNKRILRKGRQTGRNHDLPQRKTRKIDSESTTDCDPLQEKDVPVVTIKKETGDDDVMEVSSTNIQVKVETSGKDSPSMDVQVKQEKNVPKNNNGESEDAEVEDKLVVRQLSPEAWVQLRNIIQNHPKVKPADFVPLYKFLFGQPYVVKWKCELCEEFIEAPTKNYDTHMLNFHESVPRYPCEMCGRYLDIEDYISHWTEHHLEYQCPRCWKRFTNPHDLRNHHDKVHVRHHYSVLCDTCGIRFLEEEHLQKHLETHKNKNGKPAKNAITVANKEIYKCKACKQGFDSDLRYFYHQRKCKALKEMKDAEIREILSQPSAPDINNCKFFYCDECEEEIPNEVELKAHREKHTREGSDAIEVNKILSPGPLLSEVVVEVAENANETSQDMLLLCDICAYEAVSLSDLQAHIENHSLS